MKNKYVKSMMGLMLSVSLIAGGTIGAYASDTTKTATESTTEAAETDSEKTSETDAKEDVAEEDAVYGEVKSVDGDAITFTVGTRNEAPGMEKPDGEAPEKPDGEEQKDRDTEKSDEKESEPEATEKADSKDFLTLTSEEREVTVSDDTEIIKGMMFDGEQPDGEKPMAEEKDQKDAEAASEEAATEDISEEETTEDIKAAPEETLTIDDIKEGDIIKVTYDKDNNVTRIEVMSTPEEKPGDTEEKASEQEESSEEETTETATEETTES